MENEGVTEESPGELRHKVVLEFIKDISEGRLFLSIDQKKWGQQDVDLIGNTTGRLIRDLSEYVSGAVAGEEFEFLEKQIFFSISVLRTYNTLKTSTNESRVEGELRKLESKMEDLSAKISDALEVLNNASSLEWTREKPRAIEDYGALKPVSSAGETMTKKRFEAGNSTLDDVEDGLF